MRPAERLRREEAVLQGLLPEVEPGRGRLVVVVVVVGGQDGSVVWKIREALDNGWAAVAGLAGPPARGPGGRPTNGGDLETLSRLSDTSEMEGGREGGTHSPNMEHLLLLVSRARAPQIRAYFL